MPTQVVGPLEYRSLAPEQPLEGEPLDVGINLRLGWQTFADNAGALVLATLLYMVVWSASLSLLGGPMWLGYSAMCLRAARGERVSAMDVFSGFERAGEAFALGLLVCVGRILGTMMFIVPGLVVTYCAWWAFLLMADGEEGAWHCLRKSWRLACSRTGEGVLFVLVSFIIASLGSLVGCGWLLSTPVSTAIDAHGYLRLRDSE